MKIDLGSISHVSLHVFPMGMASPIANALKPHPFFKMGMVNYAWELSDTVRLHYYYYYNYKNQVWKHWLTLRQ